MTEEDFDNSKINIWVQVKGLPFEFWCYQYAKEIAKYIGGAVDERVPGNSKVDESYGQFVKVRVQLDVHKPILPGVFLKRITRKPTWVAFKYEKLLPFCYKCGY